MKKPLALAIGWCAFAAVTATTPAIPAQADSAILERPFTAEQIREGAEPGKVIELLRRTPEGETRERWTIVAADADGVSIEHADLDAGGAVIGRPPVRRSTWIELRDHATFPADRSTRVATRRTTPLGELSGWLYTTRDPAAGTVSEYFFATEYPGAPVEVRVTKDGAIVYEMTQQVRRRGNP
jgi:hypothetical protein